MTFEVIQHCSLPATGIKEPQNIIKGPFCVEGKYLGSASGFAIFIVEHAGVPVPVGWLVFEPAEGFPFCDSALVPSLVRQADLNEV